MGKKILIVDDSKTIRQQVSFTLTKGGYEVIEAEDGADGIVKLNANMPINPVIGFDAPKANNGIAIINPSIPVFINPNLSANIPPNAFPNAIVMVNNMSKLKSTFQGKFIVNPITDLIIIESIINIMINPTLLYFCSFSFSIENTGNLIKNITILIINNKIGNSIPLTIT